MTAAKAALCHIKLSDHKTSYQRRQREEREPVKSNPSLMPCFSFSFPHLPGVYVATLLLLYIFAYMIFPPKKFPWCTVVVQPLCLQPPHLPQAFPSQLPPPIRFAPLPPSLSLSLSFYTSLSHYLTINAHGQSGDACVLQQRVGWEKGSTPSCWPSPESSMFTNMKF